MALADTSSITTPSPVPVLQAVSGWFAARRQARARRVTLNTLLSMPEHRLRDLGIEPRQIAAALPQAFWPTRK